MKFLLLILLFPLFACTTAAEYEAQKAAWAQYKQKYECVRDPKLYEDPRPAIRELAVWGPDLTKYSKWTCNNGKVHLSPYGD